MITFILLTSLFAITIPIFANNTDIESDSLVAENPVADSLVVDSLVAENVVSENLVAEQTVLYKDNFSWWKLAIPSFPQYENRRFFRAAIINLGLLWLAFDIRNVGILKQGRVDSLSAAVNDFELAANQSVLRLSTGYDIRYDSFYPTQQQQQLMINEREYGVLNLYRRAAFWERRVLSAENQHRVNIAWVTGLALFSVFDGYGAYRERTSRNRDLRPFDAVARSIVLPGWGQIYSSSYSQAGFIFGMGIALGAHAYYLTKEAELLRRREIEGFTADPLGVIKRRNSYLFYLLGLYVYNIVDAYVQAELYDFGLEFSVKPLNNNLSFSFNYLF